MPTPTGLPKAGETWRMRRGSEVVDVVVIKRGSGTYWSLTVRGPDGRTRLWVDASYYVKVGELTYLSG